MYTDRGIVYMDRRSDSLSMRPESPNAITHQSNDMNNAPRDPVLLDLLHVILPHQGAAVDICVYGLCLHLCLCLSLCLRLHLRHHCLHLCRCHNFRDHAATASRFRLFPTSVI